MSGLLSYVPGINKLVGLGSKTQAVDVPAVQVHHIETDPDRRARCLKHLLKANHVNYSIIRHDTDGRQPVSNNLPHVLSSAYFLGASVQQLNESYDDLIKPLGPWEPSPAELDLDWTDFRGNPAYTRAYVDFFEDKLAMEYAYDWKKVVMHVLFTEDEPLIHGLVGDGGSALIRLAHAFQVDSKELGMEGLGLAAIHYSPLHKYLDGAAYTKPSPLKAGNTEELLEHMKDDHHFQKLQSSDSHAVDQLSPDQEALLLEYWNALDLENPTAQFGLLQQAAVTVLLTMDRPEQKVFDRGLAQLLVASHAARVLLPFLPAEHHVPLVRQWWLLFVATAIKKGGIRKSEYGLVVDTAGKDWKYVQHEAVTSLLPKDALSVQVVQSIQEAATVWGDHKHQYLAAAVTFVDNFKNWSG